MANCATITMTHPDGRTVQINEHAFDDQARWREAGFKTDAELPKEQKKPVKKDAK